jgi:hypothetical protein
LAHCYAQGGCESSALAAAPHLMQAVVILDIYSKKKQRADVVARPIKGAGGARAYSTIRLTIAGSGA